MLWTENWADIINAKHSKQQLAGSLVSRTPVSRTVKNAVSRKGIEATT
jgi:hypothetical protein